jgi:hypothetical protein
MSSDRRDQAVRVTGIHLVQARQRRTKAHRPDTPQHRTKNER